MKSDYSSIHTYTISEINVDSGKGKTVKQFHVFNIEELVYDEKRSRPSRSDHFSISLVMAGEPKVKYNLLEYSLRKNSLFIIPPGIVHNFVDKKEDFSMTQLGFSSAFLGNSGLHKKYIDAFSFFSSQNNPHLSLNDYEAKTLHLLMLLLREKDLYENEHHFKNEIIHHGFNLFMFEVAALFKKYRESKVTKLTRKEELVMSFIKLLTIHFKEERRVQHYAGLLFVTPKHLTKTVKEITNKPCGELIDEMVITEAKILLDDLSMSVAAVADALHFSDQFSFSKFFKSHAGINPSDYGRSI